MKEILQPVIDMLEKGEALAVATILSHAGSTPRTAGAKMMVRKDATIAGTVGGGLVEAEIIRDAAGLIDVNRTIIRDFTLDRSLKDSLDMVCGGELTVLIETFGPERLDLYKRLQKEISLGKGCARLVELVSDGVGGYVGKEGLVVAGEGVLGDIRFPESPGLDMKKSLLEKQVPTLLSLGDRRLVVEPVLAGKTLYVFGGGHVSLCLARVMALMDMRIVVVDDREEFANPDRFPMADRAMAVASYSEFFARTPMDAASFVVIVTRGHRHDQDVLELALGTQAGYIGMIGSRRKREQIYANLREKGVSQADIDRVYSPIGLEIHAETPAEIAVSIAAEIIGVKNRAQKG